MKKILLIIALTLCIFQMVVLATAIDMGNPAVIGNSSETSAYTRFDICNPANATGTITSVEFYSAGPMENVEIGIFYLIGGNYFSTRDSVLIGNAVEGYNQFDVDLEVNEGDYIGIYWTGTNIRSTDETCAGFRGRSADRIPADNVFFGLTANKRLSIRGTGATEEEEVNAIFFGTNF